MNFQMAFLDWKSTGCAPHNHGDTKVILKFLNLNPVNVLDENRNVSNVFELVRL